MICTGEHCAYLSLWHKRNVQHSADDLNLRHRHVHVHLGLLEQVLDDHRNVGHHEEEREEDVASSSSSSSSVTPRQAARRLR